MCTAIDRLKSLFVRDVMSRNVVEISSHQTMEEAAKTFVAKDVSSAPVVDEQGRCAGILSAADFLKRSCPKVAAGESPHEMAKHVLVEGETEPLEIVPAADDSVDRNMTSAVQSIAPEAPLLKAAEVMCAEHVHRLPVIDAHCRVVGVVSTMDIVAALLGAIEELETSQPERRSYR